MRHADEGLLQAWLDGPQAGLAEEDRAAVEEHLARCPRCVARVQALRDAGERARDLLPLAAGAQDEAIPAFDTVVARARWLDAGRARQRWRLAAGWAASVVVALGVGWLANEARRGPAEPAVPAERLSEILQPSGSAGGTASAMAEDSVGAGDEETTLADVPPDRDEEAEADGGAAVVGRVAPEVRREIVAAAPVPVEPSASAAEAPSEPEPASGALERMALSGRVTDAASGRPLTSAQVFVPGSGIGALTDRDGRFLLSLDALPDSAEDVTLRVEMLGYGGEQRTLALAGRDTVSTDVSMSATAVRLDEIVVTGAAGRRAGEPSTAVTVPPAEQDSAAWRAVSAAEAEAFAGFPVRTVPGLEVVMIDVGTLEETPVVRVVQLLDGGGRLTLLQATRSAALQGVGTEGLAAIRLDDGVFVAGWAPLPADSVRRLLERIR